MADTNLMKNCSVLFSMTISGLDTLILCFGEVMHLLEIERHKKTFTMLSLLVSGEKRIRKKLKTLYKNKKRYVTGSSKEEVTHGGLVLMQGISPLEFWKKNLHLTRNQLFNLTNELQGYISHSLLSSNHRTLNADKKLALTLYYLKVTESLIMKANNFGVAINTGSYVIYDVCLVICQNLGPQYMRENVTEFEAKFGMIQVFECLMALIYPSSGHWKNHRTTFVTSSTIH